jgi:hypothetical protein
MSALSLLHSQRAELTAALSRLHNAGLDRTPAAINARKHLQRVNRWIADPRGVDGLVGENGYGPAVRDVLREADWELTRLAPVEVLDAGLVLA